MSPFPFMSHEEALQFQAEIRKIVRDELDRQWEQWVRLIAASGGNVEQAERVRQALMRRDVE